MTTPEGGFEAHLAGRHRRGRIFATICAVAAWVGVVVLAVLLVGVFIQGSDWVFRTSFFTNFDSRFPEKAGILAGIWGSFWLIFFTTIISVPVGVGAAVYLEEFAPKNRLTRLIQVNLANLAGVPSIVYGILGLTLFVRFMDLDRSVLSAALTLSLLILPIVIMASQEALRAIPPSLRHASLSLGATEWQTVRHQVLPAAMPGIMTGVILAISRAIGETAPLVMIGAFTFVSFTPGDITRPTQIVTQPEGVANVPLDSFTAIPIQIYKWVSIPGNDYRSVAAAGILTLLAVLLFLNAAAIFLRHKYQVKSRW